MCLDLCCDVALLVFPILLQVVSCCLCPAGRCSLLPVVNNSGAICNSWKLDPTTLRFPLKGMLPYDKVTFTLQILTLFICLLSCGTVILFLCVGSVWATDRAASICARTAILKRDGLQHVRTQQTGKTNYLLLHQILSLHSPLLSCDILLFPLPTLFTPLLLLFVVVVLLYYLFDLFKTFSSFLVYFLNLFY